MDKIVKHPSVLDGKNPNELRGDSITNDRYFCKDFMDKKFKFSNLVIILFMI